MKHPVRRTCIACLLAIGLLVASVAALAAPPAGEAASGASRSAPMAAIDIGALFGDENEPEENEGGGSEAKDEPTVLSFMPRAVLVLFIAFVVIGAALAAIRVRRRWLQLRGWTRDVADRARGAHRATGTRPGRSGLRRGRSRS